MPKRIRVENRYNDSVLKNGYEAMAKINLGFAESSMTVDTGALFSYEEVLSNDGLVRQSFFDLESDDFDD